MLDKCYFVLITAEAVVLKNIVKKLKIAKIVKNWYEIIIRN